MYYPSREIVTSVMAGKRAKLSIGTCAGPVLTGAGGVAADPDEDTHSKAVAKPRQIFRSMGERGLFQKLGRHPLTPPVGTEAF